jgi:hypothetical protein
VTTLDNPLRVRATHGPHARPEQVRTGHPAAGAAHVVTPIRTRLYGSQADNAGSSPVASPHQASGVDARRRGSEDGPVVTRDRRSQEIRDRLEGWIAPGRKRAEAVSRQLIGLRVEDARELAARSQCLVRVIRRDGTSMPVTLALAPHRIDVATEDDIVVDVVMVGGAPMPPHG